MVATIGPQPTATSSTLIADYRSVRHEARRFVRGEIAIRLPHFRNRTDLFTPASDYPFWNWEQDLGLAARVPVQQRLQIEAGGVRSDVCSFIGGRGIAGSSARIGLGTAEVEVRRVVGSLSSCRSCARRSLVDVLAAVCQIKAAMLEAENSFNFAVDFLSPVTATSLFKHDTGDLTDVTLEHFLVSGLAFVEPGHIDVVDVTISDVVTGQVDFDVSGLGDVQAEVGHTRAAQATGSRGATTRPRTWPKGREIIIR